MQIVNPIVALIVHLFDIHVSGYFLSHLQGVIVEPSCSSDLNIWHEICWQVYKLATKWLLPISQKVLFLATLGFVKRWHQTN